MFTVYMAINIKNGKRYIGVTGKGMAHRAKKHWEKARAGGRECPKFYDALRKYGRGGFAWKVLCTRKGMAEAYRREMLYVEHFKPEYNAVPGGMGHVPNGTPWNRRPLVCLETGIEFPSAKAASISLSVDFSEVCKVLRAERRSAGGFHFVYSIDAPLDATSRLNRISEIDVLFSQKQRRVAQRKYDGRVIVEGRDKRGRRATGPMKMSKPVVCLDDGLIFDSASAAGRHYDIATNSVSQLCAGKYKSTMVCGHRFQYLDKEVMN